MAAGKPTEEQQRELYERVYSTHDEQNQRWKALCAEENIRPIERMLRQAGVSPSSVIDVGCGDGAVLAEMSRRGLGTSFVAYEGGVASSKATLAWNDVESITLRTTQRTSSGGYEGTEHSLEVAGPGKLRFRMSGWGMETEAFLHWFRSQVVPRLAKRDLDRVRAGGSARFGIAEPLGCRLHAGLECANLKLL